MACKCLCCSPCGVLWCVSLQPQGGPLPALWQPPAVPTSVGGELVFSSLPAGTRSTTGCLVGLRAGLRVQLSHTIPASREEFVLLRRVIGLPCWLQLPWRRASVDSLLQQLRVRADRCRPKKTELPACCLLFSLVPLLPCCLS